MGILTDAFIASESELAGLRPGAGGPAGRFPTVQAKGIEPVKLATLEAIILSASVEMWDDDGLLERDWEEEWVYRLPASLAQALAELPPAEVPRVARAWAATEEWRLDGVSPADGAALAELATLVDALRTLAGQARQDGKALYLWISL